MKRIYDDAHREERSGKKRTPAAIEMKLQECEIGSLDRATSLATRSPFFAPRCPPFQHDFLLTSRSSVNVQYSPKLCRTDCRLADNKLALVTVARRKPTRARCYYYLHGIFFLSADFESSVLMELNGAAVHAQRQAQPDTDTIKRFPFRREAAFTQRRPHRPSSRTRRAAIH